MMQVKPGNYERMLVVLNPTAGGGRAGKEFDSLCAKPGFDRLDERRLRYDGTGELFPALRRALHDPIDLVIAAGGDGTVHSVVNALMQFQPEKRPALGILPLGSGSDLARHLGLPARPDACLNALMHSAHHPADLLKLETDAGVCWCANICSVGLTAEVARRVNEAPSAAKPYLLTAAKCLPAWKGFAARVTIDGRVEGIRNYDVIVAGNGSRFGNGLPVLPDASHDDGWCDVLCVARRPLWKLLGAVVLLPLRLHRRLSFVETSRCRELILEAPDGSSLAVEADGETLSTRLLHISLETGVLNIVQPGLAKSSL